MAFGDFDVVDLLDDRIPGCFCIHYVHLISVFHFSSLLGKSETSTIDNRDHWNDAPSEMIMIGVRLKMILQLRQAIGM